MTRFKLDFKKWWWLNTRSLTQLPFHLLVLSDLATVKPADAFGRMISDSFARLCLYQRRSWELEMRLTIKVSTKTALKMFSRKRALKEGVRIGRSTVGPSKDCGLLTALKAPQHRLEFVCTPWDVHSNQQWPLHNSVLIEIYELFAAGDMRQKRVSEEAETALDPCRKAGYYSTRKLGNVN